MFHVEQFTQKNALLTIINDKQLKTMIKNTMFHVKHRIMYKYIVFFIINMFHVKHIQLLSLRFAYSFT